MVAQDLAMRMGASHFYLMGLEQIIGPMEVAKLVDALPKGRQNKDTGAVQQIHPVQKKIVEVFGPQGASGIAICSGRAAFEDLLKKQGKQIGFEGASFRFLPGKQKLKMGLSLMAEWMQNEFSEEAVVENTESKWNFIVSDLSKSDQINKQGSLCDFTIGLLQGFMAWASGGKYFRIIETSCRAKGDASCTFEIDKVAIE